jgi:peptidoglycan-associated lipoprotein
MQERQTTLRCWQGRAAKAMAIGLLGLIGLQLLSACSSTRVDALAPVEDRLNAGGRDAGRDGRAGANGLSGGGAASTGVAESQVAGVDLSAQGRAGGGAGVEALPASQRVIYFDFDSFAVKPEFRPVVEFQAHWLGADRRRRVLIEGHTDERGGREYNLALGQKRSEAVLRALELLGAQEAQMEAVSYGEERPAVAGSQEAAWAKNRRAELKDR